MLLDIKVYYFSITKNPKNMAIIGKSRGKHYFIVFMYKFFVYLTYIHKLDFTLRYGIIVRHYSIDTQYIVFRYMYSIQYVVYFVCEIKKWMGSTEE